MMTTLPLSMLLDPAYRAREAPLIAKHNATHAERIDPAGWTDKWVFQVLLNPCRVQPSSQEEEALQNFERSQRLQAPEN